MLAVEVLGGWFGSPEGAGIGVGESGLQHVGYVVVAFEGLEIPGECDQVTPETVGGELVQDARDITVGQGGFEVCQPGVDTFLR